MSMTATPAMPCRIVHLSDLHFGRVRAELLRPLIAAVNACAPDLVAISGDLTQRARMRQFQAARMMMDRIRAPILVVPGNHDVPLDNPVDRLFRPWRGWHRWIGPDLTSNWSDGNVTVVGINTVNRFDWQRGRFSARMAERSCAAFEESGPRAMRIVVAHHPLEQAPGAGKAIARGADAALDRLHECAVDMVLSGHLHHWRAQPFERGSNGWRALHIQAGTGLSTRLRGEENDFNLITLEADTALIERFTADDRATGFTVERARRFMRGPDGWRVAEGRETRSRIPATASRDTARILR